MSKDDFELVHGSGNVFRDFGDPDAEILQLKAILAFAEERRLFAKFAVRRFLLFQALLKRLLLAQNQCDRVLDV